MALLKKDHTTSVTHPTKSIPPRSDPSLPSSKDTAPRQTLSPRRYTMPAPRLQRESSPPKDTITISSVVTSFESKAKILNDICASHKAGIKLATSGGPAKSESEDLTKDLQKFNTTVDQYLALILDIQTHLRTLHPHTAEKDVKPVLVLGYNRYKLAVQCPYCPEIHCHKCIMPRLELGFPLVYPSSCGQGDYRVVFPGDIDKLTQGVGVDAIGLQVHISGAFWMAVGRELPIVDSHFLAKKSRAKRNSADHELGNVEGLTSAFGDMSIEEKRAWYPRRDLYSEHYDEMRKLQDIIRPCIESYAYLKKIIGFYSEPNHAMESETWTRVGRSAQQQGKRGVECFIAPKNDEWTSRGKVESYGWRTICCCVRGGSYNDISVVSGVNEEERLDLDLGIRNWEIKLFVMELARELQHEFPDAIPASSDWWKREMDAKKSTSPQEWFACHAEKKMLVRYLLLHTTWTPMNFHHTVLYKKRKILGEEIGHCKGQFLTRNMKFWVSYDICDDCSAFVSAVQKKFGLLLDFKEMERFEVDPP